MEVSWQLTNLDGSVVYIRDSCYQPGLTIFNYCLPNTGCTVFRIKDQYGDGLAANGYYRLYLNNVLLHENLDGQYDFGEKVYFGCAPGGFCALPFILSTGSWVTPAGLAEAWYSFTPADTGTYQISTCFAGNPCPTKIWIYDHCADILLSNDQTGASFYADGGCPQGALANLYLAGGHTYYLRLRYADAGCSSLPIHFSLLYTGAVAGCTDPTACNYNPLASVSTACLYPGDPACPNVPDLVVLEDELRNSMFVDMIINPDACAVDEGCLRGTGPRTIIRFTTHIKNKGGQDYFVGSPPMDQAALSNQFMWDACHQHWHYRGYAEYALFNSVGSRLPVGTKNGFCLVDLECNDGGAGKYTCENMGISAGCGDTYAASYPCQWIDITGLPADNYTLVVRVNWDKSPDKAGRIEQDYANNWAQACFELTYAGPLPQVEFLENDCPQYADCLGEIFGDAQPDCAGVCGGLTQRGDWDGNTQRNTADVDAYLQAALSGTAAATECRDLFADGRIDVYDAALLQECNLYANDLNHWGVRLPCQFPTGFENGEDVVSILPGLLDTVASTFDIQILNPFHPVIGYDFSVSGLDITAVENLAPGFDGGLQFNAATGRILALSPTEKRVQKSIFPVNLLRIHYQQLTSAQVCVTDVHAVVNAKYQKSQAGTGPINCANGGVSAVQTAGPDALQVYVQPNPFYESTTLFYANPEQKPMTITLTDLTGHILRAYRNVRAESITFERGELPAGIYLYTVQNGQAMASGKITAW